MGKNIQLCGLGNALVDLLFEVSFEEMAELPINIGEMRHCTEQEQADMLARLRGKKHAICSGGSAANSIIAFAKFGGRSAYSSVLGNDEFGHFYTQEFKEIGIDLYPRFLDGRASGTCVVLITPDSERSMHTCLAATAEFGKTDVYPEVIAQSEWIYLEGYKFVEEASTEALFFGVDEARKHGAKVSLTFSDVFMIENHREGFNKAIPMCDLVFCNENEAVCFTGKGDSQSAFEALCSTVPSVCMTKGANGSLVKFEGKIYEIPAFKATPVDTTGAGDMYAGAFLYGITNGMGADKAGRLASLASARVVSQIGARLRDNHADLLKMI